MVARVAAVKVEAVMVAAGLAVVARVAAGLAVVETGS